MRYQVHKILVWGFMSVWALTGYVGCSEVKFSSVPTEECLALRAQYGEDACTEEPGSGGVEIFTYGKDFGDIDLLFVVDNSGSMSFEQSKMANRVDGFIDFLENSGFRYQIGVITTDVTASLNNSELKAANGNGAYQDGKLLQFTQNGSGTGTYVLTPQTGSDRNYRSAIFKDTLKRQETLDCEAGSFLPDNCPSYDERGIYAANLAVDRMEHGLFREDAHLAIIFLSDEDEKGKGNEATFGDYDFPETLVSKISTQLGITKNMSFHSIVVKPGDSSCKADQTGQTSQQGYYNQFIYGEYGDTYARLSDARDDNSDLLDLGNIVGGFTGDICANDYASQISTISNLIDGYSYVQPIVCPPDRTQNVDVFIDGVEISESDYTIDASHNVIVNTDLQPGAVVTLQVQCQK